MCCNIPYISLQCPTGILVEIQTYDVVTFTYTFSYRQECPFFYVVFTPPYHRPLSGAFYVFLHSTNWAASVHVIRYFLDMCVGSVYFTGRFYSKRSHPRRQTKFQLIYYALVLIEYYNFLKTKP